MIGEPSAALPVEQIWRRDDLLVVDGVEVIVTPDPDRYMSVKSTPDGFVTAKTRPMVELLTDLVSELRPRRMVELGIFKGGSAALLALLARPEKLSAFELERAPVPALEALIEQRSLQEVIACHYGVDQGDAAELSRLVDADHGEEPLDLVVDDASHLLRETRTAFEVLFPRLRPGGVYLIEDWGWAHFDEALWQEGGGYWHDRPALTNLIVELMMMVGTGSDVVADIRVTHDITIVTRGPRPLRAPMQVEAHYRNRGLPFRPLI